jgi:hypothetical protein
MLNNKSAIVKMEEGYMRVIIEYTQENDRAIICDTIGIVEKELEIYPEVIHRRSNDIKGTFSVEFGGSEDYVCTRSCGDFIEKLLNKLDIKSS